MSFKDDFLEALRSVKRDIFRETDPQEGAAGSRFAAEIPGGDDIEGSEPPRAPQTAPGYGTQSAAPIDGDDFDEDDIVEDYGSVEITADLLHNEGGGYAPPPPPPEYYGPAESTPVGSGGGRGGDGRQIFDFGSDEVFDDEKTVISRNTVIRGALSTEDSVRLLGQVLGDIECKSNIVVAGKVRGNTTAANAYVLDAQIDGNMMCEDSISVNDDAWILGNIRANQAEVDGKVKGNLEIRHNVSIGPSSSVIGNISADELEIKRGAFINGQIIMYSPSRDVLDRFDQFDGQ